MLRPAEQVFSSGSISASGTSFLGKDDPVQKDKSNFPACKLVRDLYTSLFST